MKVWRQSDAVSSEPGGHYGGVEASDIVDQETTGSFTASTMYCPPGSGGGLHQHDHDGQLFVMVEGSLTFDTGKDRFTLGPMEAVLFEPGDPHSTINETTEGSTAVVVTVPIAPG